MTNQNNELEERIPEKGEELVSSKNTLTETIERISDAMVVLDKNWRFTFMNKRAGEIFKLNPVDMIGRHIWTEIKEGPGQSIYNACHRAISEQLYIHLEQYYPSSEKWIEIHIYPSPGGLLVFLIDLTENKTTGGKLEQSEKRFRALIENIEGIISLVDENLNVLFRSSSAARITGWTNEEYEKTNAAAYIHPDDVHGIKTIMTKAVKNPGETLPIELRVRHKTGHYIWLEGTVKNMLHEPAIGGIITNLRDITEKKKAEESLNQSKVFIESIINASPDIIYIYDIEERKNIYVNEGIQSNLGFTDEEIKQMGNQLITNLMHPDDFEFYLHNTYPRYFAAKDKEIVTHEYRIKDKSGNWHWFYCKESVFLRTAEGTPRQIFGVINDITESKKAEQALKESEEKYRISFDRVSDAFVSVDTNWCYTFMNQKAGEIFNRDPQLMMGKNMWIEFPEELGSLSQKGYVKAMAEQIYVSTEEYFVPWNKWIKSHIYPSPGGLSIFFIDITQRKKTEQVIKESEEKYRTLVEQASDAIFIADTTGQFISVNTSACRMAQCTEEELLRMSIYDFAVLEDIQNDPFHFNELKQGKTVIKDRVMKRKDGVVLNVEINAKLLNDGRLLSFVRDISERKKNQQALIERQNHLSTILQTEPECIKLLGKNGELEDMNPAGLAMIEADDLDQLKGKSILGIIDERYRQDFRRLSHEVFEGSSGKLEFEIVGLKGTRRWLETHAVPLKDAGGKIISLLGITRDITDRKKSEEDIQKTTEQLRQLTTHLQNIREEERKRIGREIHDELGQQLTAIKMDVAWIDKKMPDKPAGADETILIKNKLKNIITLLDGTNQSVRKILNELRPGVLDDYGLVDALEWQGRQFTESTGIDIVFTSSQTDIQLPQEIATCLFRLYQESLTNIMRYAQAGNVVTSLSIKDNSIILTVKDNGIGFNTLKQQTNTSFGILGMKERVLSLNGKFELISSIGKGTSITISIPLVNKHLKIP